jgi:hypothetical protein
MNNDTWSYEDYLEWDRDYKEYVEDILDKYTYNTKENSNIDDVKWEPGF